MPQGKNGYFFPTVQTADSSVITASKLSGSASPYGGAGPVKDLSTNYTFSVAENGFTYTNINATGSITITVPSGLPVGTVIRIAQTNGTSANTITVSFSGGEYSLIGATSSTIPKTNGAGGSLTFIRVLNGNGGWIVLSIVPPTA